MTSEVVRGKKIVNRKKTASPLDDAIASRKKITTARLAVSQKSASYQYTNNTHRSKSLRGIACIKTLSLATHTTAYRLEVYKGLTRTLINLEFCALYVLHVAGENMSVPELTPFQSNMASKIAPSLGA